MRAAGNSLITTAVLNRLIYQAFFLAIFKMPLPTFIVIGPGKSGSTWLYKCLKEHPEIRLAKDTKETLFFNHNYNKGLGWYEKFFDGLDGRAIGEVSNDYFFSPDAPARIAADLPDVRLITMLRNPIDRLISMYHWNLRNGNFRKWFGDAPVTLDEAIETVPDMLQWNRYRQYLDNYLRCFRGDQIFVALYDDIKHSPEVLIREIYAFLRVDPNFVPSSLNSRFLSASEARFGKNLYFAKRFGRWLRKREFYRLLTWCKTNPIILKLLTKPVTTETEVSDETRARLRTIFDPHIRFVEKLVGRNLEHWR